MNEISKLITPTLEDYKKNIPKPVAYHVKRTIPITPKPDDLNVNDGWIAPYFHYFECEYGGHEVFADTVMNYYPEMVEEFKMIYTKVIPYEVRNKEWKEKYGQDMSFADYLVAEGWMKWQNRKTYHEVVKGSKDLTGGQWQTIGWLDVYSCTPKYKITIIEEL